MNEPATPGLVGSSEGLGLRPERSDVLAQLRLRILREHGGLGDGWRDHWNLTPGDSLMHREAVAEIERLRAVVKAANGPRLEPSVGRLLPERASVALQVVPCDLKTANEFVRRLHRHSRPVVGHKFAVAVAARLPIGDTRPGGAGYGMHMDCIVGVAIVGRPVAPRLDDGRACEITRLCTDGTPNACSMLYGAARKAARAMGHAPIYTYTLPDEGGASLRAAGFRLDKEDAGGSAAMWHSRPGRTAQPVGDDLIGGKWRWIG